MKSLQIPSAPQVDVVGVGGTWDLIGFGPIALPEGQRIPSGYVNSLPLNMAHGHIKDSVQYFS